MIGEYSIRWPASYCQAALNGGFTCEAGRYLVRCGFPPYVGQSTVGAVGRLGVEDVVVVVDFDPPPQPASAPTASSSAKGGVQSVIRNRIEPGVIPPSKLELTNGQARATHDLAGLRQVRACGPNLRAGPAGS